MVRIAARQTVVIDKDLQFALPHRRVVEMRQVVNGRPRGMHGRLINQIQRPEHLGIGGDRGGQCCKALEEGFVRWPMSGGYRVDRRREISG